MENSNQGWRLLGATPENYGNIGEQAVDLSNSTSQSFANGATGDNSFAVGKNTEARGNSSAAIGEGTIAIADGSIVVGKYNDIEPEADPVIYVMVPGSLTDGTIVFNLDGTYTFTPPTDATGDFTFEYYVCDDAGYVAS